MRATARARSHLHRRELAMIGALSARRRHARVRGVNVPTVQRILACAVRRVKADTVGSAGEYIEITIILDLHQVVDLLMTILFRILFTIDWVILI